MDLPVLGYSNKMIAQELGLSPKTVEDHRAAIVTKTGTRRAGPGRADRAHPAVISCGLMAAAEPA